MIGKYPNISLTFLLILVLLPPFALKTFNAKYEPYPAVIFPDGSDKINVGQTEVCFQLIVLKGKNTINDSWENIDVKDFLDPIPHQYFYSLAKKNFGINPGKVDSIKIKQGKEWLSRKLVQSGFMADEIMISTEQVKFNINIGQIVESDKINEKIIRLD